MPSEDKESINFPSFIQITIEGYHASLCLKRRSIQRVFKQRMLELRFTFTVTAVTAQTVGLLFWFCPLLASPSVGSVIVFDNYY